MHLTNFRQKYIDTCNQTQIDHAKCTCAGDAPTSQITKHFPKDADHPLNKWCIASSKKRMIMLNNHDVWGLVGIDRQCNLSILHILW